MLPLVRPPCAFQAARSSNQHKLEVTLINNLGTVLRNQHKYKRVVALHRQHLAAVEERYGLHSSFLILARHNLVDILNHLHRSDEARDVLTGQLHKLTGHLEHVRQRKADGWDGVVETGATGKDEAATVDAETATLVGLSRCHMDHAKFLESRDDLGAAVADARKALTLHAEANGEVRFAPCRCL